MPRSAAGVGFCHVRVRSPPHDSSSAGTAEGRLTGRGALNFTSFIGLAAALEAAPVDLRADAGLVGPVDVVTTGNNTTQHNTKPVSIRETQPTDSASVHTAIGTSLKSS